MEGVLDRGRLTDDQWDGQRNKMARTKEGVTRSTGVQELGVQKPIAGRMQKSNKVKGKKTCKRMILVEVCCIVSKTYVESLEKSETIFAIFTGRMKIYFLYSFCVPSCSALFSNFLAACLCCRHLKVWRYISSLNNIYNTLTFFLSLISLLPWIIFVIRTLSFSVPVSLSHSL